MRLLLASIVTLWFGVAFSQPYPSKPIKLVVPVSPGGGLDLVGRTIGEKLAARLGQPIVVENRPGASEIIGTTAVARSAPDGYTLLLMSDTLTINAALDQNMPYDTARDLVPVARLVKVPFALVVHPKVAASSVKELVAWAKAQPGKLNAAHLGVASAHHMTLQWFKLATGTEITSVPYKGAGPALLALVAGEVDMMFVGMGGATPHIEAGRIRAMAVTSEHRVPSTPDLPTLAESGYPEIKVTSWFGIMVPTGTPSDVVERLHSALVWALALPDVKQRFLAVGMEVAPSTPNEFGQLIQSETRNWREVVQATGVKATPK